MLIGGLTGARMIASKLDEEQRSKFWNITFLQVCYFSNLYHRQCAKTPLVHAPIGQHGCYCQLRLKSLAETRPTYSQSSSWMDHPR